MRTRLCAGWICVALVCAAPAAAKEPAPNRQGESAMLQRADVVAAKTAKLRGLAIKRPIKRGVMDKAQLKARLLKRVNQEYSPAELRVEELMLKRFGLLDEPDRYLDIVMDLLTNQIAGFYDPWEKQLYLASFQMFGGDMLMAHEIDHALQDQHFDLRKFMQLGKHENDAVLARQALVEGDGTALMVEYLFADMKRGAPWGDPTVLAAMKQQMGSTVGGAGMGKAPLFLREGLLFPYLGGLEFVAHFRKVSPWKRIDELFRKPPLSTEHILHPLKYVSYEKPVAVTASKLRALPELELLHHNVNGEFGLSVLLQQLGVMKSKARLAAAGWGGDRSAILGKKNASTSAELVGVLCSVWDDEADAREFEDAVSDIVETLAGIGSTASSVGGKPAYKHASGAISLVERRDDRVVLVVGVPEDKAAAVLGEVFAWKVSP